jgi:hypothetical protein
MANPTSVAKAPGSSPVNTPGPRWGDPGVSERFYVQDTQLSVTPNIQQIILADAGILSELRHHMYANNTTGTHGTGTSVKDVFGPHDLLNFYQFTAGANTPLVAMSGRGLGIINIAEYPRSNWEANADPADVMNPLTNFSDVFNFPGGGSASFGPSIFRDWLRIPLAIRWLGMPGGMVGYVVLQNKRIANIVKPTFNVTGAAAPYSLGATTFGNAPYLISGNDTVTGSPIFETHKVLNTVPSTKEKMPVFGFTRYLQEIQLPYAGSSFTYNFEPGGVLLRAILHIVDATAAGGIATTNVSTLAYQYGTNKQLDIYTPFSNLQEQEEIYGRVMPQGVYAFDYYTRTRNLVNAKSTENTANVQIQVNFSAGYTPPANSIVYVYLDKVYIVQNYLG